MLLKPQRSRNDPINLLELKRGKCDEWKNRATTVAGIEGWKNVSEKFQSENSETTVDNYYYTALIIYIIILLIVAFGAAKLSYNYNRYIGTPGNTTILYTILAFLFSEFYYPFYAYFIDPLANIRRRI